MNIFHTLCSHFMWISACYSNSNYYIFFKIMNIKTSVFNNLLYIRGLSVHLPVKSVLIINCCGIRNIRVAVWNGNLWNHTFWYIALFYSPEKFWDHSIRSNLWEFPHYYDTSSIKVLHNTVKQHMKSSSFVSLNTFKCSSQTCTK